MGIFSRIIREIGFLLRALSLQRRLRALHKPPLTSFADRIAAQAKAHPDWDAVVCGDEVWSYADLNARANKIAYWMRRNGLKRGDKVALLMENRAEYLASWIGIIRAGGTAALINTHLTGRPLAHCIKISASSHMIMGAEMAEQYDGARDLLEAPPEVWAQGGAVQGCKDMDEALAEAPEESFVAEQAEKPALRDDAVYIYTSGTTGNPKAARISHYRMLQIMTAFDSIAQAKRGDRVYIVLPLYHSAGGLCAVGMGLFNGGAVILRRRFSGSAFWSDVVKYRATVFQYIGELCRYLLLAPPDEQETAHKLRFVVGNGLRPEIWADFQERFKIPRICEFYGATEGNVSFFNDGGKTGAIGWMPLWVFRRAPMALARFDIETEEPVRGEDGFCIRCDSGEAGEALGQIIDDPSQPTQKFEGYVGKKETEGKIMRDVFAAGDAWFRTGDLLRHDNEGYFYFVDRIGDTFRWKGENVATSEVAEALSVFAGVQEANVYGVQIKGTDGRAGMASLVSEGDVDLGKLHEHLAASLPVYARPLFLRMQKTMDTTGTFKHRKVELVKEGFDPSAITEPLFFDDPEQKRYVPLTAEVYQKINDGGYRL